MIKGWTKGTVRNQNGNCSKRTSGRLDIRRLRRTFDLVIGSDSLLTSAIEVHDLAKVHVEGSNSFVRPSFHEKFLRSSAPSAGMASNLRIELRRFAAPMTTTNSDLCDAENRTIAGDCKRTKSECYIHFRPVELALVP